MSVIWYRCFAHFLAALTGLIGSFQPTLIDESWALVLITRVMEIIAWTLGNFHKNVLPFTLLVKLNFRIKEQFYFILHFITSMLAYQRLQTYCHLGSLTHCRAKRVLRSRASLHSHVCAVQQPVCFSILVLSLGTIIFFYLDSILKCCLATYFSGSLEI